MTAVWGLSPRVQRQVPAQVQDRPARGHACQEGQEREGEARKTQVHGEGGRLLERGVLQARDARTQVVPGLRGQAQGQPGGLQGLGGAAEERRRGRPQVVLRHVGRAAVKGAARMAGAASSGRPIPDGERVTRVNIGSNRSFQKMKWQSRGRTGLSLYL